MGLALYAEPLHSGNPRGKGMAGKILAAAEEEAKARGCHGAWIDTFNPQALHTYQQAGYEIFGELPQFPKGRTRSVLRKSLG
ncbi:acetyltransferase (GNAT) family protein [Rhizobium sullae]|uniref:Acetyltransferase (GNAT) family protein n=1 Tax=Rhizobium sullae TaxID=50338 RepID=A0A4R3QG95_RHISU|nr:acetyltransferase (GNAT) family protein [Rhizobium sullae]